MGLPRLKDEPIADYSIYIYHDTGQKQRVDGDWERKVTTFDKREAFKAAKDLYGSDQYQKVEVKKKFFDRKKDRTVDMTVKIFEDRSNRRAITIAAALFFAVCILIFGLAGLKG